MMWNQTADVETSFEKKIFEEVVCFRSIRNNLIANIITCHYRLQFERLMMSDFSSRVRDRNNNNDEQVS